MLRAASGMQYVSYGHNITCTALCALTFSGTSHNLLSRVVGGSFAAWSSGSWQEQLSNCWMIPGLIRWKSSLEMGERLFCTNISASCPAEKQDYGKNIVSNLDKQISHQLSFLRSQSSTEWVKRTQGAMTACSPLQSSRAYIICEDYFQPLINCKDYLQPLIKVSCISLSF